MSRLIFFALLFTLAFVVIKRLLAGTQSRPRDNSKTQNGQLIQCSQCGLRVPLIEGKLIHGKYYCNNTACNPEDKTS